MDQRDKTNKNDNDGFRFIEKAPPFWPRVIGIGISGLLALLLVAYSTFVLGSIAMSFIGAETPSPYVLIVAALAAIAFLLQLR